jgi:hypothetical protein
MKMVSAVCIDAANKKGKLRHEDCRGWFKEMLVSGMTGMDGHNLISFGRKVKCKCSCHIRYES